MGGDREQRPGRSGPDPAQGRPGNAAGRQVPEQRRRPGRSEDHGSRCDAGRPPRGTERGVRSGHSGHGVSDVELLARMREGDDRAYEELYRRHAEPVRRYARTCCRDADTAEDLTGEVFARTLQAVRGGKGPEASVRAYLLASVRRVAADWARTRRRERLVDDFAAFAQAAAGTAAGEGETLAPGAEVRAMREAEQRLIVRAFRSLSEYDRMLLWHTAVEGVPPQEVAPLLGKTRGATATAAHRAREHLKQAYLQAHVSQALTTEGGECARYADRLGAYARGGLRMRAERGLARHLEECPACHQAASEVRDLNEHIRLLVPVALVGWFGTTGGAQAFGALLGTGAPTAGGAAAAGGGAAAAGGAAAGSGGSAGAGGAASEGLGAPAKAGIGLGVVAAAGAVLAYALSGGADEPSEKPEARHPAPTAAPGRPGEPSEPPRKPDPAPRPGTPGPGPAAPDPAPPRKEAEEPRPATSPAPAPAAEPGKPEPPRRTPPPEPAPAPPRPSPPRPAPPPAPPARHVIEITRDTVTLSSGSGDRTVRLVVKRHPATVGGAVSVELSAPNWPHSSANRSTAPAPVSGGRRAAVPPAGE